MAGNIIDYVLRQGKYSFAEREFNDVDSLALCQLSYLKFDGLVGNLDSREDAVTLAWLAQCEEKDTMFADERYREVNMALFTAMASSERFGTMGLNYYENIIDTDSETQFSAVVCFPQGAKPYLAFRGTDETMIGWKEDFNMAFLEPVIGQLISVKYVSYAAKAIPGEFYMGGHSKGGNFAVYAGMKCEPEVQERIACIYSHDGPGFRPEILKGEEYDRIKDKVCKMIPHSSVVGMLLQYQGTYEVVESRRFGLMQHDPYNWLIKGSDFIHVRDVWQGRKLFDETLNEWILSLPQEQLKLLVETMFEIASASQVDNLVDFTAEWKKSMNHMINALKEMDEDTRKNVKEIIGKLFEIGRDRMRQNLKLNG